MHLLRFPFRVLCETVKDFVAKVGENCTDEGGATGDEAMTNKCAVLNQKLDALITTLNEESHAVTNPSVS